MCKNYAYIISYNSLLGHIIILNNYNIFLPFGFLFYFLHRTSDCTSKINRESLHLVFSKYV